MTWLTADKHARGPDESRERENEKAKVGKISAKIG